MYLYSSYYLFYIEFSIFIFYIPINTFIFKYIIILSSSPIPTSWLYTLYRSAINIIFTILSLILNYFNCPQSPTARVHVAAGGNIIGNSFLMMAKCRGDGREPSQRVQRAVVAVVVLSPRRVRSIALNSTRSLTAFVWSSRSTI